MIIYASALKKLFKIAYPKEAATSTVLLQQFVMGLRSDIGRQLLLKKTCCCLEDAVDIEYALEFNNLGDSINALTRKLTITTESQDAAALQWSLEALTKCLDSLEITLQRTQSQTTPIATKRQRGYRHDSQPRYRGSIVGPCYNCGNVGHLR